MQFPSAAATGRFLLQVSKLRWCSGGGISLIEEESLQTRNKFDRFRLETENCETKLHLLLSAKMNKFLFWLLRWAVVVAQRKSVRLLTSRSWVWISISAAVSYSCCPFKNVHLNWPLFEAQHCWFSQLKWMSNWTAMGKKLNMQK